MLSFDELHQKVKETLSEKRFYHSECVAERCVELAKLYGVDVEKARKAGILHDIAKEIHKSDIIQVANKYEVELDDVELNSKGLIHAKLGAKICEIDFGVEKEICDAIACHTTGKENMTLLEKILYIADAIGIDRTYDNTKELLDLAFSNLDKAVQNLLKFTIDDRIKENKLIHLDSVKALNYLIIQEK